MGDLSKYSDVKRARHANTKTNHPAFFVTQTQKREKKCNSLLIDTQTNRPYSPYRLTLPHRGDVQGPQAGELRDPAGDVALCADAQRGGDARVPGGVLHGLQPPGPRRRAHQPEEGQRRRQQEVLEAGGRESGRRALV